MGLPWFLFVIAAAGASIPGALTFGGRLVRGQGGHSLSELQLLLWTTSVAISYLLHLWKLQRIAGADLQIKASENLLLLVGFSAGSYLAASGIRAHQDQKGQLSPRTKAGELGWRALVSNGEGEVDLSKLQPSQGDA